MAERTLDPCGSTVSSRGHGLRSRRNVGRIALLLTATQIPVSKCPRGGASPADSARGAIDRLSGREGGIEALLGDSARASGVRRSRIRRSARAGAGRVEVDDLLELPAPSGGETMMSSMRFRNPPKCVRARHDDGLTPSTACRPPG